jgi:hypothetical protein
LEEIHGGTLTGAAFINNDHWNNKVDNYNHKWEEEDEEDEETINKQI